MTTAAATLREAARLVRLFGHNPYDPAGSPLSGYSLIGAIATVAAPDPARPVTLARHVRLSAALAYLLDTLGHDPDHTTPGQTRGLIDQAGRPMAGPYGRLWAAAVLDQAATLAAASCLRAPLPPTPAPHVHAPRVRRPRPSHASRAA